MALEFTNIPDRTGAAVYLLGDGTTHTDRQLTLLGQDIDKITPDETQVVLLDPKSGDGLRIKEFYSIMHFPCVMIVQDDDTVPYSWNVTLPSADDVSYHLGQIGGAYHS